MSTNAAFARAMLWRQNSKKAAELNAANKATRKQREKEKAKAKEKAKKIAKTMFDFEVLLPLLFGNNYKLNVSTSEMEVRQLFLGSLSKMAADFKGTMTQPDYQEWSTAANNLYNAANGAPINMPNQPELNYQQSFKIAPQTKFKMERKPSILQSPFLNQLQSIDEDAFNQHATNANQARDHFTRVMLLTSIHNAIKDQGDVPLFLEIEKHLDEISVVKNGLRIPTGNSAQIKNALDGYLNQLESEKMPNGVSKGGAGVLPLVTGLAAATAVAASGTGNGTTPSFTPSLQPSLSFGTAQMNHVVIPPATSVSTRTTGSTSASALANLKANINRASASASANVSTRTALNSSQLTTFNHAMNYFGVKHEVKGPSPLSTIQKMMLDLSGKIETITGISVYSPSFNKPEAHVTKETKEKYAFIRAPLEELKLKLATESPERFGVLQYNSIMNILRAIRVGNTHVVQKGINVAGRTTPDATQIPKIMTDLANYDPRYSNVSFYVEREAPTTVGKLVSFFKGESNFVIKNVYITYTFNEAAAPNVKYSRNVKVHNEENNNDDEKENVQFKPNDYVLQFDPLQFRDFEPLAARYVMPSVGNIEHVMSAIKDIVELDASFIGFYRPNTSIAAIIANLQAADPITRKIIANVAEFSKLAIELTKLQTADLLIAGLNKDANDHSKAVELRIKSFQLQEHVDEMVSRKTEWDVATVDKLVRLAADMAVTSGQLDKTLKDDAAMREYFTNVTAKFGNGLMKSLESVADLASLTGDIMKGTIKALSDAQKLLIRGEILLMYLGFMIYYMRNGYLFGFWAMPLIKPLGPAIVMEQIAQKTLGVEPSIITNVVMMYLFYLVWDRQTVDPLTNSMKDLFSMCRFRQRNAPNGAPNGAQGQAPNGAQGQAPNGAPNGVRQAPNGVQGQVPNVPPVEPVQVQRRSRWNRGPNGQVQPPVAPVQPPVAPVQPAVPVQPRRRGESRWGGPATPRNRAEAAAFWVGLQHQNALRREAEQQGRGRRTRKNKKQNRRRTRK